MNYIDTILAAEPQLKHIINEAAKTPGSDTAYNRAKARADGLVGFGAKEKTLQTEKAYWAFLSHLCDRMNY